MLNIKKKQLIYQIKIQKIHELKTLPKFKFLWKKYRQLHPSIKYTMLLRSIIKKKVHNQNIRQAKYS